MTNLRTFLHLLSVAVWVGGQVVLAVVVAAVRPVQREVLPVIARAFGRVAWPALGIAIVTGVWWLTDVDVTEAGVPYQRNLAVKLALVAVSGAGAAIHALGHSKPVKAASAAIGLAAALGAMFAGVALG